jgi:NAD+ kinase
VVSSPTGSTAYSLSLGGPILTPDVGAKVLIPVNPHTLFNRSLVVSEYEDIEIVPRDGRIEILADGLLIDAPDTSVVTVGSSDKKINIIRFKESLFVENLRERLFRL